MSGLGPGPLKTPPSSAGAPPNERLPLVPKLPWLLRATPLQMLLGTVAFGLCVFVVALASDWAAFTSGLPTLPMMALSDAITAVVTALFASVLVTRASERRRIVHDRLRMVAELNHRIRNALEIIQMTAHAIKDDQAISVINEAADRIQLALREILGDSGKPPK